MQGDAYSVVGVRKNAPRAVLTDPTARRDGEPELHRVEDKQRLAALDVGVVIEEVRDEFAAVRHVAGGQDDGVVPAARHVVALLHLRGVQQASANGRLDLGRSGLELHQHEREENLVESARIEYRRRRPISPLER